MNASNVITGKNIVIIIVFIWQLKCLIKKKNPEKSLLTITFTADTTVNVYECL